MLLVATVTMKITTIQVPYILENILFILRRFQNRNEKLFIHGKIERIEFYAERMMIE